jgi:hypothetical protein
VYRIPIRRGVDATAPDGNQRPQGRETSMARKCVLLGMAAALWLLSGCGGGYGGSTVDSSSGAPRASGAPDGLVAQSRPPIPDLPVPLNFELDESKSRNFLAAGSGSRYVDHVYTGPADKFAVARFYKRQMPVNRWRLETDNFVQGKVILQFQKESETCQITISDAGGWSGTRVEIQLFAGGRAGGGSS